MQNPLHRSGIFTPLALLCAPLDFAGNSAVLIAAGDRFEKILISSGETSHFSVNFAHIVLCGKFRSGNWPLS